MVSVANVTRDVRQTNKEMTVQLENIGIMIEDLVTLLNTTDDETSKAIYRAKLRTVNTMCMHLGIGYDYEYNDDTKETRVFIMKTKNWA